MPNGTIPEVIKKSLNRIKDGDKKWLDIPLEKRQWGPPHMTALIANLVEDNMKGGKFDRAAFKATMLEYTLTEQSNLRKKLVGWNLMPESTKPDVSSVD